MSKCLICSKPVHRECYHIRFGLNIDSELKNIVDIGLVHRECISKLAPWAIKYYLCHDKDGNITIHAGHCSHCKYLWGPQNIHPNKSRYGTSWTGPYNSLDEAKNVGGPTAITHRYCLP